MPLKLKTNPLIRRVFGFEGELALKSLQRDRKRYRTTVLSLMISIILFVAFNALMLYTDTTQRMASKAMNWDLQIDLDSTARSAAGCLHPLRPRGVRPPPCGDHRPGLPGPAGVEQP